MYRREVRWERMFRDELEQAFAACPLVYFTYGLCEPHGPHCALGLDALKAHGIACQTAHQYGGIVAPPDYWHIHESGGYAGWAAQNIGEVERAWMTAMPPWQHFKNVICYHLRTVDMLGFHAAIFLTGHYGPNWQDLKLLLELAPAIRRHALVRPARFRGERAGLRRHGRRPCGQSGNFAAVGARTRLRGYVPPAAARRVRPAFCDGPQRGEIKPTYRRAHDTRRGPLAARQSAGTSKRVRHAQARTHPAHICECRNAHGPKPLRRAWASFRRCKPQMTDCPRSTASGMPTHPCPTYIRCKRHGAFYLP